MPKNGVYESCKDGANVRKTSSHVHCQSAPILPRDGTTGFLARPTERWLGPGFSYKPTRERFIGEVTVKWYEKVSVAAPRVIAPTTPSSAQAKAKTILTFQCGWLCGPHQRLRRRDSGKRLSRTGNVKNEDSAP